MLLFVALLHAGIILVFAHSLVLAIARPILRPLLVSIVASPPKPAAPAPDLLAPKLKPMERIVAPIAPLVTLPSPEPPPPPVPTKQRPAAAVATGPVSMPGDGPPHRIGIPLDVDAYYPVAERLRQEEGTVLLQICIYSTGKIAEVHVAASSGDRGLDDAALQVAHASRWKPAVFGGKPVTRCIHWPINFTLTHQPLLAP